MDKNLKKIRVRLMGEDGIIRSIMYNDQGEPIYYSGYAKDFKLKDIKIINKNATAQEIIDDVEVHIPWD